MVMESTDRDDDVWCLGLTNFAHKYACSCASANM